MNKDVLNISIQEKEIIKIRDGISIQENDLITVEEPVEMAIEYGIESNRRKSNIAITMRTPGDDENLIVGFLFTEGIISNYTELIKVEALKNENRVIASISSNKKINIDKLSRHLFTSSSCGVCGKTSIDNLKTTIPAITNSKDVRIYATILNNLPKQLLQDQSLFNKTGSIHAAGLYNTEGELITAKEDVGRHNALDKLIGWSLANGYSSLQEYIILLSGRISFELVQKALMAGCKIVAAVGAPSSLAIELADEYGMTLIGFLKQNRFNIYTHKDAIAI